MRVDPSTPRVSILMPVYNGASYLSDAIGSVVSQTYSNWELVIVDDGSTDDGPRIAERFAAADKRIVRASNRHTPGPAGARNTAVDLASGRFISFLDSDDTWEPTKLEVQVQYCISRGVEFVYSGYHITDSSGLIRTTFVPPLNLTFEQLLNGCAVGTLTVMYDTSVLGRLRMNESLKTKEDYELWLRIARSRGRLRGIPDVLARYRAHSAGLTGNSLRAAIDQWRFYRRYVRLAVPASAVKLAKYAVAAVRKRYWH